MSGMEKMGRLSCALGVVKYLGNAYLEKEVEFLRPEIEALVKKMETNPDAIDTVAELSGHLIYMEGTFENALEKAAKYSTLRADYEILKAVLETVKDAIKTNLKAKGNQNE